MVLSLGCFFKYHLTGGEGLKNSPGFHQHLLKWLVPLGPVGTPFENRCSVQRAPYRGTGGLAACPVFSPVLSPTAPHIDVKMYN